MAPIDDWMVFVSSQIDIDATKKEIFHTVHTHNKVKLTYSVNGKYQAD